MNIEPDYNTGISRLDYFIENNLKSYSRDRNYDFGPTKRDNVSGLSPFFSHRILFEYHLIDKILQMNQYSRVEKFIQEIFWRIYWKGWMEMRPSVWDNFLEGLNRIKFNKKDVYFKIYGLSLASINFLISSGLSSPSPSIGITSVSYTHLTLPTNREV